MTEVFGAAFGLDQLSDANVAALVDRTDGWPVGVYLAGLGLRNEADPDAFVERFSGDGRHLSEYLSAEAIDDLDGFCVYESSSDSYRTA